MPVSAHDVCGTGVARLKGKGEKGMSNTSIIIVCLSFIASVIVMFGLAGVTILAQIRDKL